MFERHLDGYIRGLASDSTSGPYQNLKQKHWSKAAIGAYRKDKGAELEKDHGTPARQMFRMALTLYREGRLDEEALLKLGRKYRKVAVLTREEHRRLSKNGDRSTLYRSPDERWAAHGITVVDIKGFDKSGNFIV